MATPRVVISHDQGLQVLDATTLAPVGDIDLPGFNRLKPAGDGRHLVVSTTGGFCLLDVGTWADRHGDHSQYYTTDPALTATTYPAVKPGHVVVHAGRTAYVTDPAANKIYAVDYATGKVDTKTTLTVTPNEIEVAAGESEPTVDHPGHHDAGSGR